jgi:hypothetical protein
MRKFLLILMILSLSASASAQEGAGTGKRPAAHLGEAAGYSSRDATTLSMMGWGLGLAIGFAALCALIDNNAGASGSSSHSH